MAEMTAEEAAEWGKTLNFSTAWAYLTKVGERIDQQRVEFKEQSAAFWAAVAESEKKYDKMRAEARAASAESEKKYERMNAEYLAAKAESEKKFERMNAEYLAAKAESEKKFERMSERVDRVTANVGGLNVSMGELIETLFGPHIGEKFDAYNYNLRRIYKRVPLYDETVRQRGEIDLLLSDTTVCMALEVKRWLNKPKQVDEHIQRMKLIRQYPPAEVKGKKLYGAMAGAVVDPAVRDYAEQSGFFVLDLAGNDIQLLEPPETFQPKEW